jgi:exopolyphosphatase/guanosine-5'-triphosphate,3'-diphosphate pyrophosphatase
MSERLAVIDFGTNTARLLIAEHLQGGDFRTVHLQREVVRMGGGFSRTEGLSADAVQRGLACLTRFSSVIREHNVHTVLAVATSAVRDALNGDLFVKQVRQQTGIELRTIDGAVEGILTLAGVMTGLDQQYDSILVLDIGGGSTEFTLARSGQAVFVRSLPLGVVRLTEGKASIAAMETKIRKELDLFFLDLQQSGCDFCKGITLVGTAGTATTLAAISMEMDDYDYRRVNNASISKQEVSSIYNRLLPLTPMERLKVPGLEKGREDLIISGTLLTMLVMDLFGVDTMKVSDFGLLEGLVVRGKSMLVGNHA